MVFIVREQIREVSIMESMLIYHFISKIHFILGTKEQFWELRLPSDDHHERDARYNARICAVELPYHVSSDKGRSAYEPPTSRRRVRATNEKPMDR